MPLPVGPTRTSRGWSLGRGGGCGLVVVHGGLLGARVERILPEPPPAGGEDADRTEAKEDEGDRGESEIEQTAHLAAALGVFSQEGLLGVTHGEGLLGGGVFVDEVVDAELEVGAVELFGEGWELADAGDGAPGGAVDGVVVGGAVERHATDVAVREDGEADKGGALLVERRASLFGDEGQPGGVDLVEDAAEIGVEVDAHGVGEDVDAGVHALMLDGDAVAVVAALTGFGGLTGGLADGVAGALIWLGEVGFGGSGGCVGHSLLLRLRARAVGDGRPLLGLLLRLLLGLRGGRGGGGGGLGLGGLGQRCCGSGRAGLAHGLKLLEGLAVERRMAGLLGAVLVAEDVGWLTRELLGNVLGEIEIGQLAIALLEDIGRVDQAGLMEDDLRAVEDEPADGEPDDDGDVDGFAEAGAGALVVDRIEEVDELVGVEVGVAPGADLLGGWRCGRVRWRFEDRHRGPWVEAMKPSGDERLPRGRVQRGAARLSIFSSSTMQTEDQAPGCATLEETEFTAWEFRTGARARWELGRKRRDGRGRRHGW